MTGTPCDAVLGPAPYFELRISRVAPGGLAAAHRLMGEAAPALFRRADVPAPVACWHAPASSGGTLHLCLIPWSGLDARMAAWKRLSADADWIAANRADGQLRAPLGCTDISILKPSPAWDRFRVPGIPVGPVGGIHELRVYDLLNQDPVKAHDALAAADLPFFHRHGAEVLGVFQTWFGTRMNQAVTFLAWPDERSLREAHRAHHADPDILSAREAERLMYGRPLVRACRLDLLVPSPYAAARTFLTRPT